MSSSSNSLSSYLSPVRALSGLHEQVAVDDKLKEAEDRIDNARQPPIRTPPGVRLLSGVMIPSLDEREKRIHLHREARRAMQKGLAAVRLAADAAQDGHNLQARVLHARAAKHWKHAATLCESNSMFNAQLAKVSRLYTATPHGPEPIRLNAPSARAKRHPLTELVNFGAWDSLKEIALKLPSNWYPGNIVVSKNSNFTYIGQADIFGNPKGQGFKYISEHRWEGCDLWRDGKMNGEGEWCVAGYPRVAGTFSDHEAHGMMTFYWADGTILKAAFQNGQTNSNFIMTLANGDRIEGMISSRINSNFDLEMFPNQFVSVQGGWEYHGSFDSKYLPDGPGTFYFTNGGRFEGTARHGQPDHGEYIFGADEPLTGFKYLGGWSNAKKHGAGVLIDLVTEARHACRFEQDVLTTPAPTAGETKQPQNNNTGAAADALIKALSQLLANASSAR